MTTQATKPSFQSYEEFWPFYLSQHSKATTRGWHFVGTSCVLLCIIASFLIEWRMFLLAPVIAYGLAWISHFFIEGNKPATFGHPVWSLRADFRMYGYMLVGKLGLELRKHGLK
ncbi:hypothetical protein A8990_1683 [Paenibacillus taihuensis]|uniref:DUF962 domain-containing protein n=1 Tax=Paenibacillus taihuensis TaxID=1156355 RepID=A0A3D9PYT8_9BACL|nr:DUF962 domain-containing protein [Paenibacillus taihuensis]REE55432.1 hypothetical protein A8990_1683 [Paenibacillus taihuensis]